MQSLMLPLAALAAALGALPAQAADVPALWWSYLGHGAHTLELGPEGLRLRDGSAASFLEGDVALASEQRWSIHFEIDAEDPIVPPGFSEMASFVDLEEIDRVATPSPPEPQSPVVKRVDPERL
jgi:hypothetical protein